MYLSQLAPAHSPSSDRAIRTVIVIGAGVVGMATAYCLARAGMAVTIVDRAAEPGSGASHANGAQLSYVFTDALANPALIRHMPALLMGLDPAFRFRPSFDPDQISWLLAFLRNATKARFDANTLAGLELGLQSRRAMHALLDRHDLAFLHRQAGKIHIHQDAATFTSAARMVELKRPYGAVQEVLTEAEVRAIEPALAGRDQAIAGAILTPQEEVGDPRLFCIAMKDLLVRDYGVQTRFGSTVTNLSDDGDSAEVALADGEMLTGDHVVICAGIAARRLIRQVGVRSPLMGMKGYSFNAPPGAQAPLHSITDVARKLVFCQLGDNIRIAGLVELGGRGSDVVPRRIAMLKASAEVALPNAADYTRASDGWAGIRPMSPTSLPDTRQVSRHVSINVGHGMLGWTFAMGSAEHIASQLLQGAAA